METMYKIAYTLFVLFICYGLYRYLRANPESLSGENLSKSATTMGLISIALIGFIGFVVMLLRG